MLILTRNEIHDNFIAFMERERFKRDLSTTEMAKLLGIAESTYRNIIYHRTETIDIALACKMFDLTHNWMWQMCGYESSGFEVLDKYTKLPQEKQQFMREMVCLVSDLKIEKEQD